MADDAGSIEWLLRHGWLCGFDEADDDGVGFYYVQNPDTDEQWFGPSVAAAIDKAARDGAFQEPRDAE